jgi:hypothetical protein
MAELYFSILELKENHSALKKQVFSLLVRRYLTFPDRLEIQRVLQIAQQRNLTDENLEMLMIYQKKNLEWNQVAGNSGETAFTVRHEKIFPDLMINGRQVRSMILDTGWPVITLSRSLADRLKVRILKKNAMMYSSAVSNGPGGYWDIGLIDSLKAGDMEIRNVICAVMPFPLIFGIDGAAGGPVLFGQLNFRMDLPSKKIEFFARHSYQGQKSGNLYDVNGKPYIDIQIDQKKFTVMMDTGSNRSFGSQALFMELRRYQQDFKLKPYFGYDISGFRLTRLLERKENLTAGNTDAPFDRFFYMNQPFFHQGRSIIHLGIAGTDLIRQRVILDYDRLEYKIE